MEETITPITDETGNASHFVAVMQDITEALNRQEQEVQLHLARQKQQKFYRAAPSVSGFDVAAAAYPAYETSGDYFDFIPLPHNRLGIAVGDVEGHGFGSALVMALTRAYVHSFAAPCRNPEEIRTVSDSSPHSSGGYWNGQLRIGPHFTGSASRGGNVAFQRVIHHHAIGVETPA